MQILTLALKIRQADLLKDIFLWQYIACAGKTNLYSQGIYYAFVKCMALHRQAIGYKP